MGSNGAFSLDSSHTQQIILKSKFYLSIHSLILIGVLGFFSVVSGFSATGHALAA